MLGRWWIWQAENGLATNSLTPTQTSTLGQGRTAVSISTGTYHTCATLDDGSVVCWGYNQYGQLGDGGNADRWSPTQIAKSNYRYLLVYSGGDHTCGILYEREIECWGRNYWGQLGDNSTLDQNSPSSTVDLGPGRTAAVDYSSASWSGTPTTLDAIGTSIQAWANSSTEVWTAAYVVVWCPPSSTPLQPSSYSPTTK